jgi:serine/threonine protein kinase
MSPSDENLALIGSVLDGRYEVLREIGQGSMGAVFEGRHAVLGRRLAIKVLRQDAKNPSHRERFFHEAKAAGSITHQHIVQVQDFGVCPSGEPYYVMEYVDGESLQAVIDRDAPLSPEDSVEICAQALSALETIHRAGLVHRDVKPANIMLVHGARPRLLAKLLDFGIVKAIDASWNFSNLTRVNEVLGTPVYLSPEQAAGGLADPRWDLFSMGTILYEMLSGELPFPLESLLQISDDIMHCRFTPLRKKRPELPSWLLAVQERAHQRDQASRFQSAAEFLQALDRKKAKPEREVDSTLPYIRLESAGEPVFTERARGFAPGMGNITTDEYLQNLSMIAPPQSDGRGGDTLPGPGGPLFFAQIVPASEHGDDDTVVSPAGVEGTTDPRIQEFFDPQLARTDPFPKVAVPPLAPQATEETASSALDFPDLDDGEEPSRPDGEQEMETVKLELPPSLFGSPTDELVIASSDDRRATAKPPSISGRSGAGEVARDDRDLGPAPTEERHPARTDPPGDERAPTRLDRTVLDRPPEAEREPESEPQRPRPRPPAPSHKLPVVLAVVAVLVILVAATAIVFLLARS